MTLTNVNKTLTLCLSVPIISVTSMVGIIIRTPDAATSVSNNIKKKYHSSGEGSASGGEETRSITRLPSTTDIPQQLKNVPK